VMTESCNIHFRFILISFSYWDWPLDKKNVSIIHLE